MKRSYIKRKGKGIRKVSDRQKLILACEQLMRKIIRLERGRRCQFCRRTKGVGLFHIMPKGQYQRIRFHRDNLLLAWWFPCHYTWHHDPHKAKEIEKKIMKLRGSDYKERLTILNKISPKLTDFYLKNLKFALERELENKEMCKK